MSGFPWLQLGIDPTKDAGEVRRAYANALRALDLDKDVQGYAELRRARDEALWLAAQDDSEDDGDYGLGSLDDEVGAREDLGFDPASVRFSETEPGAHAGDLHWDESVLENAGAGGFEELPPEPELDPEQEKARDAWRGLMEILIPAGEYCDDAVTLDQLDEGNRHLAALIRRADECDIVEHDALDHGLAQLMAEAWPRSAPFVETAADAFHWLDESGQIEERPALMFLNLRLRGMRFHEKVQEPDHPLNKAWVELSRPGRANFIDRMRVKRMDVHQLLTGIRERYPEVESYLDEERVASWEGNTQSSGPGAVPWFIIVIVIVGGLRLIGDIESDRPLPVVPPISVTEPRGLTEDALNQRLANLFGEGVTMIDVRAADPVFADQLRNAAEYEPGRYTTLEGYVRSQAYRASSVAEFDELVALGELKRIWMAAAQQGMQSAAACKNVMVGDFNSIPLLLDDAQAERERVLLRKLLDAGVLNNLEGRAAGTFSIPGWAIERTIQRSGLSDAQVTQALRDPQNPNRCTVEYALLGVVLEEPGRVSAELLRGL